ncbi:hypothetical protein AAE02nite_46850 [Adhaeribacter aerolatus]|uniref:Uncharacterized protein n=1 Tax=Adhaeribacter aerolatus TaxID=670289 RepID=A0A512B500_9BACT|nr:hypothetical protein [Adhaeribacter aerolatus]GEO07021.1 hypothetical protein AAE02nite_46850 [Adhaeribacter aerolatus]
MFKHNAAESVLSQFNPVMTLKPRVRKLVNDEFLIPIIEQFFSDKGGIVNFEPLDTDKLKTEIEFGNLEESFVQDYVYKEIINTITKSQEGVVCFKPRYVITFDEDLTTEEDGIYGALKLGNSPILYYIKINLQSLIRFIKLKEKLINVHGEIEPVLVKNVETQEQKRNRQLDQIIRQKEEVSSEVDEETRFKLTQDITRLNNLKNEMVVGESGFLQINLAWESADDLDLHVETPSGTISYNSKIIEHKGIIGELDIDKNAQSPFDSQPQENVFWPIMPQGRCKIKVHFYTSREKSEVPFTLSILPKIGIGRVYDAKINYTSSRMLEIAEFEFINEKLEIVDLLV